MCPPSTGHAGVREGGYVRTKSAQGLARLEAVQVGPPVDGLDCLSIRSYLALERMELGFILVPETAVDRTDMKPAK